MKTIKCVVLFVLFLSLITGCVDKNLNPAKKNYVKKSETFDSTTIIENAFFPYSDGEVLAYDGNVLFDCPNEISGNIEVDLLKTCTDGNIYVLRLEELHQSIGERSNLYFFVSNNSIWKLNMHDLLVADTEKAIESINSSSDMFDYDMSTNKIYCLVCTNDVTSLKTDSDTVYSNDEIISSYRYSNSLVETGYYETVVFEQNKGLTKYISGYGALRDHVNLTIYKDKVTVLSS